MKEKIASLEKLYKTYFAGNPYEYFFVDDNFNKQYFSEHGGDYLTSELKVINKKPITAGQIELAYNPRARSAKLRALQRK